MPSPRPPGALPPLSGLVPGCSSDFGPWLLMLFIFAFSFRSAARDRHTLHPPSCSLSPPPARHHQGAPGLESREPRAMWSCASSCALCSQCLQRCLARGPQNLWWLDWSCVEGTLITGAGLRLLLGAAGQGTDLRGVCSRLENKGVKLDHLTRCLHQPTSSLTRLLRIRIRGRKGRGTGARGSG